MTYYFAEARETECYYCGDKRMCVIRVSDPERETGYVDEIAICYECEEEQQL